MKIEYDKQADALYIRLTNTKPNGSVVVEEGIVVDLDKKGHLVGIEVLDASERVDLKSMKNVSIEPTPYVSLKSVSSKKRLLKKAV